MSHEKAAPDTTLSEDEIAAAVADALTKLGLTASSQDTGGGISCVVLQHKDGGEIVWGTADVTWGAAVNGPDGEYVSSIETACPSDAQDVTAIVQAIKGPSINSGAVITR